MAKIRNKNQPSDRVFRVDDARSEKKSVIVAKLRDSRRPHSTLDSEEVDGLFTDSHR